MCGFFNERLEVIGMAVADVTFCPECGTPEQLMSNHKWLNSGVIVLGTDETQREILVECENLDPLFKGIAEVIGMPIDKQVIDVCRRSTRKVIEGLVPQPVKDLIVKREMDLEPVIMGLTDVMMTASQLLGWGKFEHVSHRYENDGQDYFKNRCTNPYSDLLNRGNLAGTIEGIYDTEAGVQSEEVAPGVYEMTARLTGHSRVLEERLKLRPYRHRDGDIELERCSICGVPKSMASFEWSLEDGIIRSRTNGRRIAIMGPDVLEAVFDELEAELGEAIPRAVVEAQRRFIKGSTYSIDEMSDEGDFRTQLATRGYGNLREIKLGAGGIDLSIDNAAAHLMLVGMTQALFEMAFELESSVEWEISEDEDLQVRVIPLAA
jgi:hypothetical protein